MYGRFNKSLVVLLQNLDRYEVAFLKVKKKRENDKFSKVSRKAADVC